MNIVWQTEIPGEGYSSPIVTEDAVYLTTAREVLRFDRIGLAMRVALVCGCALLMGLGAWLVVARARREEQAGSLMALTVAAYLVATMSALTLFGEGVLDFDRAIERAWLAGCVVGTMALLLVGFTGQRNRRGWLVTGIGLVVFGVLVAVTVPYPNEAFSDGLLSAKTGFMGVVMLPPMLLGLVLIGIGVGDTLAGALLRRMPIAVVCVAAAGLVAVVLMEERHTATTLSVGEPYVPVAKWWVVAGAIMLLGLALWARRRWDGAPWANVAVVAIGAATLLVVTMSPVEHLMVWSNFLAYQIGKPEVSPMLGWWGAGGVALVGLASALAAAMWRHGGGPNERARTALVATVLAVAALNYAYARYVPKGPIVERSIVSVARADGSVNWISKGLAARRGMMHSDNSPATPTPVTDGERVYAWFGTPGLLCVDLDGKWVWRRTDLPFEARHGTSTSPILCGDAAIILSESDVGGYLVAVDRESGDELWRTERDEPIHEYAGNCRTPCVMEIGGRRTIVVWGYTDISGYDPATGQRLWRHEVGKQGDMNNPVTSIVSDERHLYLAGPRSTIALARDRLPGDETPIVWETPTMDGAQCASPVLAEGLLFAISDVGSAFCLDVATGEELWVENFSGQTYASPVLVSERVYFTDTAGRTDVVRASPHFEVMATNELDELTHASIAPVDGRFYMRTESRLYCIAEQ